MTKKKETGGMTKDFDKAVIYLKNCVATTITTHFNLYPIDTDLENNIEAQSKEIASINHKLNNRSGGKGNVTNVGSNFPTTIKDKFYEDGDLFKCYHQTLLFQGY